MSAVELTEQLRDTWASVASVCAPLTASQWRASTDCPGWDVRAQVAHLMGTESMLLGRPTPPFDGPFGDHVRNDIARFNEHWIAFFAETSDADLLATFSQVTAERLVALEALEPSAWDVEGDTPIGRAPYRRFMEIRVFDSWIHLQDIRFAVAQPGDAQGPAVERCLDEVTGALGFVIGKRSKAPEGTHVRFSVAPPTERTIDVVVSGGRAKAVSASGAFGAGEPTVTLSTDAVTLVRLGCGRVAGATCLADGSVTLAGDRALGERVAGTLAFTM